LFESPFAAPDNPYQASWRIMTAEATLGRNMAAPRHSGGHDADLRTK